MNTKVVICVLIISIVAQNSTEEKFDIEPILRLTVLNDIINKTSDGIVEIYLDNPSTNNVTLNVLISTLPITGMYSHGAGFLFCYIEPCDIRGLFEIPPGNSRTIYVNIKSERAGVGNVLFRWTYWPGNNENNSQSISLKYEFITQEASPDPKGEGFTNPRQISISNITEERIKIPGLGIEITFIILVLLLFLMRKL